MGRHFMCALSLVLGASLGHISCGVDSAVECPETCELGCVEGSESCLPTCVPQCENKGCGPDACGGQCGICDVESELHVCDEATGKCVGDSACVPNCVDKACGSDGCGSECQDFCNGECDPITGICDNSGTCTPNCEGKECGDDGCGGECPDLCPDDAVCLEDEGTCQSIAVPYAACQNPTDTTLFVEGGETLHKTIEDCGKTNRTESPAIATCLAEATELSDHCIQCWAELMHCALTLCMETCANTPNAPECNECLNDHCKDALALCSMISDAMEP